MRPELAHIDKVYIYIYTHCNVSVGVALFIVCVGPFKFVCVVVRLTRKSSKNYRMMTMKRKG